MFIGMFINKGKYIRQISGITVICFLISLILCAIIINTAIESKIKVEQLQVEELMLETSIRIKDKLTSLLSRAQALSVLVIQEDGSTKDLDKAAPAIIGDEPAILNVILAPDGIVSNVYPLQGSEAVIGLDFFSEGPGNREAQLARDTGSLVLGGPFEMIQGGLAIAGRMPVYVNTTTEKNSFWGLASVTVKFPEVLENAGLEILASQNLAYELWRINPDTGERQVIAHNLEQVEQGSRFVEKEISILNADWYLKVYPAHTLWYSYPETYILIVTGLFISFLILIIVENNTELRKMKTVFEEMSNVDPVTGIHNRRYMDNNLRRIIKSLSRSKDVLSLLMIDVDLFKNYNDAYGHSKGDACLKALAEVLRESLFRADDFVARYGGEEFTIVLPSTNEKGARTIADRLLENIRLRNIPHKASAVADRITISIGVTTGVVQHIYSGDDYIKQADKALYMSKQSGRDRYTYLAL